MRTYRYPPWPRAIHLILGSLMALIGVSIAAEPGNSDHSGTAPGYIAFGSAIAALFILLAVVEVTARLIVGEHGLTWGSVMRSRSVPWADIQDVLIVPASGMGPWYRPAIRSGGRLIRIQGVAGSHSYIASTVATISDAQLRASGAASITSQGRVVPPVI
jgi:hypothetical protein